MVDKQKVEQAIRLLLEGIGEDITREGLIDTPDRIARMCVQLFLDGAKCFAKSLEMYHFPCTQETDRISNFRDISYYTENIVISGACFLFCCKVFK